MHKHILMLTALLSAPATAQGEEEHLPFLDAETAFRRAAAEGKRVLVYQDWPG